MSNHFKVFRQRALGFILIVGLGIGLITPIAQAEAPTDTLYAAPVSTKIVDGMTAQERADKIDAFYIQEGNLPLAGEGLTMVDYADEYNINWELVAAFGFVESTGGANVCLHKDGSSTYDAFGYNGCGASFANYNQAIATVTRDIAGQIPATAKFFADKTTDQIIDAYNPPYENESYLGNVTWTMNKIASIDPSTVFASANTNASGGQLAINQ